MICPKCKNKNFNPTQDIKSPLKNIGGKEKYDAADFRRYVCMQCGHAFLTCEKYERPIEVTVNLIQEELFSNGDKSKKS